MSISDMSPVAREDLVEQLAEKLTGIIKDIGPLDGRTYERQLVERTGYPRDDVQLALGRVSVRVLSDGRIGLKESAI